ncbi:TonB-dependent receptor [Desulfobacula toluolica]|uniref:TonB-dependent receptor n=1 Tax=Desulfobacula toluolica (strain DSM 7467 / Tol2) TaxID=651182 RepID=K0NQC9_DESTT|nr:TonB-dependent receptor [Desulfobacula toluolica]CCK82358.1 TonB-dependent receptor [Desulfobacula toluolica Tol2]
MKPLFFLLPILILASVFAPSEVPGFTETKAYVLITKADIEGLRAGRIQDVLNLVPGVNAGDTSIAIRGVYKVRVVMDGKMINDPTSSYGGVKWETISLQKVESIKVYKSSGSTAFGSDASGGVIVITTDKTRETSGFVEAHTGNFDTHHTYLSCRSGTERFSLSASAGLDRTDGYRPNADKEKKMIQGDAGFSPDNTTRFRIFASQLSEDRGSPGMNAYPTPNARYAYDLFSGLFTADIWKFQNKLTYIDAERKNTNPDTHLDTLLRIEKIRDELTRQIQWDHWGNLSIGSGGEKTTARSTGFATREETHAWGFATFSGQLDRIPVQFSLGGRVETYSEFDESFSPEITAGIHKNAFRAKISFSRTHNIPSFYQRYYQSTSMLPNPDLTPEQADNISLSLSMAVSDWMSLDLSPFYNRITDRITYVREGSTGSYVNLGKVTYTGVDLSFDVKPGKNLKLKTTYTYLEAKDENTGLFLSSKPRHRAMADLVYTPAQSFCLRLSLEHVSSVFANKANTRKEDGYTLGNVRLEYRLKLSFLKESVTLFTEVKNIGDTFYMYGDGYSGAPRTWITGARIKF